MGRGRRVARQAAGTCEAARRTLRVVLVRNVRSKPVTSANSQRFGQFGGTRLPNHG